MSPCLQCLDTVGWEAGRACDVQKKLKCCYSSGDDETGALTIATSIVSFVSKIQNGLTLWY